MELIPNVDLFLEKQPPKQFERILCSPLHLEKPINFSKRAPKKNELLISCLNLLLNYPDKDNDLDFCYSDFLGFLKSVDIEISESGTPLYLKKIESSNEEKFSIIIKKSSIEIQAASTKAVRQALIFLEDEIMRQNAPILPIKTFNRTPSIKTRISRCFFTPPSHASSQGSVNELMSDIDYYPNNYLNRLAHQGINGIWIGSSFKTMLKSEIFKEYGYEEDVQVKKLNQIIKKCKKFGIDVYLFVAEPASSCYSPEINNYKDLISFAEGFTLLCPSKQKVKDYIKESVTRLFTLVPELGGIINITVGESLSTCASVTELQCPNCLKNYKTIGKALAATEKMFSNAVKEIAPKAKFISWTYEIRTWKNKDVDDSCLSRDKDVIHLQNFEDLGRPVQLGKKRLAYDYWLSYAGPGELIKRTTKISKKRNVPRFAKIQVCSSHEISTVPYIPVPGILYDKYKYMQKNGFSGVMQCWYFGNYPSLMNKSASLLSYLPFYRTKISFLNDLAKIYCPSYYKYLVKAWQEFEKGYKNFPVNLAFEWVGPMQDSPCIPLHLKPKDWPMAGTWLKSEQAGDRIGECLLHGHTIDEVLILTGRMCQHWKKGVNYFEKIKHGFDHTFTEQLTIIKAIGLIFESGYDTLKFYKLRHVLGTENKNELNVLNQMRLIVENEIRISTELLPLCKSDIRIGYHSEANGYKIFPEKLKWRINELENLLRTEFVEVEKNIVRNKKPLPFYYGSEKNYKTIVINDLVGSEFQYPDGSINKDVSLTATESKGKITLNITTNNLNDEFQIKPEFNILFPKIPMYILNQNFIIKANDQYAVSKDKIKNELRKFKFEKEIVDNRITYKISFKRKTVNLMENEPFRLAITCSNEKNISALNNATKYFKRQLLRGKFSPESYCFFIKNDK